MLENCPTPHILGLQLHLCILGVEMVVKNNTSKLLELARLEWES